MIALLPLLLLSPTPARADPSYDLYSAMWDRSSTEVLQALEGGADPNGVIPSDYYGNGKPFMVSAPLMDDLATTRFLLDYGGNPNLADDVAETAIHKLVAYCPATEPFRPRTDMTPAERASIISLLFKSGAKFDSVSKRTAACPFGPGLTLRSGMDAFQMALAGEELPILGAFAGVPGLPLDALTNDETPLMSKAKSPDVVDWLLDQGANPNIANSVGRTALDFAIDAGVLDAISKLLAKSADPNHADKSGTTPLALAAKSPQALAIAQLLLAAGAQADPAAVAVGQRPLVAAAAAGQLDLVKLLIAHGASIANDGANALEAALLSSSEATADALVSLGASVDGNYVVNGSGETMPLVFAMLSGAANSDARMFGLRFLASHHGNLDVLDAIGGTPLMHTAENGWLPELDFLVAAGVKLDVVATIVSNTALTLALSNTHCDAADHLIAAHTDVNLPKVGVTITTAIQGKCTESGTLGRILDAGATLAGLTVLHDAINAKDSTALATLIAHQADLEALLYSETPLADAVAQSWADGAVQLLKAGANPNVSVWNTPLLIQVLQITDAPTQQSILTALLAAPKLEIDLVDASKRTGLFYAKTPDVATALIGHGAKVASVDSLGETPIFPAVENSLPAVVNVLLKAGAKPDQTDLNGDTPMNEAKRVNNAQVIALLCKFGSTDPYCNPTLR